MNLKKAFLYISMAFSGHFTATAQQELMLSQMPKQWQFNTINPAAFPEGKRIAIGLPGFGVDARHSGALTLGDFYQKSNGTVSLNFEQVLSKLDPVNELTYRHRVETVSFGIRLPGKGKTAISVGHAIRFNSNTQYNKELVQLFWAGNAQFIGQTIQIAPSSQTQDWHEISVGISRAFGKLRAGARIKYLAGISNFTTDPNANQMSVYTNPDIYQLELNTDYGFHSAGIVSAIDTNGLGFKLVTNELNNQFSGANSGLAFDLGLTYQVTDKLTVFASALDLGGSMRWEAASYFHSKGSFNYDGAVIPGDQIINGSTDLDFSTKLDSLNDIFKFNKTTTDFSTAIPSRYYAGATFDLSKRLTVGASFFQENGQEEKKTAFGASIHIRPVKWIGLGVMYNANRTSAANIGAQLSLSLGPTRIFLLSDNLSGVFSPTNSPAVHFRTGLSLLL